MSSLATISRPDETFPMNPQSYPILARACALVLASLSMTACGPDAPPSSGPEASASGSLQPSVASPPAENAPLANATVPTWRPLSEVPAAAASSRCHIDDLAGKGATPSVSIKHGESLAISGWLATQDGKAVPANATVRLEDGANGRVWEVPIAAFTLRQDVADANNAPALAKSGFSVLVDTWELAPNAKHVYLAFQHEGKDYLCDGGHQVIIQ